MGRGGVQGHDVSIPAGNSQFELPGAIPDLVREPPDMAWAPRIRAGTGPTFSIYVWKWTAGHPGTVRASTGGFRLDNSFPVPGTPEPRPVRTLTQTCP